ncbi:MAG: serine/threonine-protein kinase [Rubritalea sp.]|uniref:serine/threonine protein kinase n=1 Tax=Rubritalea sp. TaxID=2109375 RepID=UPI00324254B3
MSDQDTERDPVEEVASEFMDRCRNGEPPSIEEYVARYPDLSDSISELFPTIVALEQIKVEDRKTAARNATLKPLRLTELGDFEILREIGRGGMGIVYEANQKSLGRKVALKVLPKPALLDPVQLRRFQREARIAAQLHHTNIVSLYGIGEDDGFHFLVMELIQGVSLRKAITRLRRLHDSSVENMEEPQDKQREQAVSWLLKPYIASSSALRRGPLAKSSIRSLSDSNDNPAAMTGVNTATRHCRSSYWGEVARIGRDVAHALQHASEQKVMHRDIKPGNILLDHQGKIWITDFGLAQALSIPEVSATQNIAGTLNYIPPEGFSGQYNQQSDIYSLGVTLYELLCLRPAYSDQGHAESLQRIANNSFEPARPSAFNPEIPRDLEFVVLKAMAQDPDHRYKTASDFAIDLELFIANRPVNARRTSSLERSWRWCKRNKTLSALATLAVSLLMLVSLVMTFSYLHARQSQFDVQTALIRERYEREHSEATLNVAINALDDIYKKFAPIDIHNSN